MTDDFNPFEESDFEWYRERVLRGREIERQEANDRRADTDSAYDAQKAREAWARQVAEPGTGIESSHWARENAAMEERDK